MNFDKTIFEGCSSVEKAYAISQLDPFHDMPYRLEGAPSDAAASSVVMVVNQEKSLSASDFGLSVTAGSKWDLHIVNIPMLQPASFYPCQLRQSCNMWTGTQTSEQIHNLYPITCCGVATNDPTFAGDGSKIEGVGTSVPYYSSNEGTSISIPRCMRLIGLSYEVVDETPKFYQQGAVTVYNRPSSTNTAAYTVDIDQGGSSVQQYQVCHSCVAPLNRIAQATIIPTSKTWKASEGVYVVCRRNGSDNPFTRPSLTNLALYSPIDPVTSSIKNSYFPREAVYAQQFPIDVVNADSFNSIVPYNMTGAYFTGLSGQYATLRLRTKFIYEILPDPQDTSLIPLATPTVPRNYDFETLLEKVISEIPYGVPQTMNPKGEFWGMILKTTKKVGQQAIKAAQSPLVQGLASAVNPTAGAMIAGLGNATKALQVANNQAKTLQRQPKGQRKRVNLATNELAKAARDFAIQQSKAPG